MKKIPLAVHKLEYVSGVQLPNEGPYNVGEPTVAYKQMVDSKVTEVQLVPRLLVSSGLGNGFYYPTLKKVYLTTSWHETICEDVDMFVIPDRINLMKDLVDRTVKFIY